MNVKICGITNIEDANKTIQLGADAIGFVFYRPSKRFIEFSDAKKIIDQLSEKVLKIGVFVNDAIELINEIAPKLGLDLVQLHGEESLEYASQINTKVIKAFRVDDDFEYEKLKEFSEYSILLDSKSTSEYGGTGLTFDWSKIPSELRQNIILAGGVSLGNIEKIFKEINPTMVDLSSSVEKSPGVKDHNKLEQFFNKVNGLR